MTARMIGSPFHIRPAAWTQASLCATHNPAMWDGEDPSATPVAKRLCARCPVRLACLREAMEVEANTPGDRHTIRGGLTAAERAAL